MPSSAFLGYASAAIIQYRYPLLFIGAIVEGPLLMIASGFFLHAGVFSFVPLYLTLILGDLAADVVWYYVGYFFGEPFVRRYGAFVSLTPDHLDRATKLFHKYHARILFISKVTIGFGLALATLVVAGASRVPFRMYMLYNVIGEIVLVAVLISLGYFLGNIYEAIASGFRIVFIVAVIPVIAATLYGFSQYAKKRLEQS